MSRADLPGADLPGADLPGADLPGADLPGADLPGADLPGAGNPRPNQRGDRAAFAASTDSDPDGRYAVEPYFCRFRDPALEQAHLAARDGTLRRFISVGALIVAFAFALGAVYDILIYGPGNGLWLQATRALVVGTALAAFYAARSGVAIERVDRLALAMAASIYICLITVMPIRQSDADAIALYFLLVNMTVLFYLPISMSWGLAWAVAGTVVHLAQRTLLLGPIDALGALIVLGPALAIGYAATQRARHVSRSEFAAIDIATRALAETREAERRFRLLAENVSDVFITIDANRLLSYVSPSVERVLGYAPDTLLGRPALDLVHPDDAADTVAGLDQAWAGVEGLRAEFRVRHADGRWIWVEASPRLMQDRDQPYLVTTARDISIRVERDAELRRARFDAEAANHAKSRFLAQMSHELRTPLNAVIGFAEVMRDGIHGPLQPAVYGEYAAYIEEGGRHLLTLINDVLDLAKVEAGRMDLAPRWLDLDEAAEGALRLVRNEAQDGCLELHCRLDEGMVVHADPRALKQILVNLLANAVKFTPLGGEVALSAQVDAEGSTVIAIADTGIGMSRDQLSQAMEPYRQVHGDSLRESLVDRRGTGLGLPLARALTELHGARFAIASEPGKGTRVTLTFPPGPQAPELRGG